MAKGETVSPASTIVPTQKSVGPLAYDHAAGGETVSPSAPTAEGSLQLKRRVSQTSFADVPAKGEILNPAATVAPVPTNPAREGVRPLAVPKAWET
jgi:hypothetical protein